MSSYIDHTNLATRGNGHSWGDFTHKRLWWHHGPERAFEILKGRDPQTNADLTNWNTLGRKPGRRSRRRTVTFKWAA